MAITEELELDITGALDAIDSLNAPLTELGANLTASLTSAIEAVDVQPLVDQLAAIDAAGLTTTIDAAVQASDGTVVIEADTAAVPGEIDSSIASADTTVTVEADVSGFGGSIDEALAAADATVTVDADASLIAPEIETEIQGADTTVTLEVDATSLDGVTSDLEGVTTSADGATESFSGLDATVAGTAGGFARFGSAGLLGVGLVAGGITSLVGIATDAIATQQRFNQTFGDLADEASRVNLGGLNSDLGDLAIKLGSDDEGLQDAASSLFQFGKAAGFTNDQALELVNNSSALAARAVALNPALGEVGDVAATINNAFARGGKFASKYGLALTAAEITARALANTGKASAAELTVQEKALAGSQIAAERYGKGIKKDIEDGSKNAVIQQRSLNEQLQNFLEEAGKPLVAPFQQLLKDLIPVAKELIPVFGELAEKLLPLFAEVISIIAPPFAEFVSIAADLISKVPAEAIAAIAAAFLAFKGFSIASDAVSKIKDIGTGFVEAGGKMKDFFKAGGGFDGLRLQAIGAKDRIVDIGKQFATLATQLAKKIVATIQTKVVTGAAGGATEATSQGLFSAIAAKLGITATAGGLFLATLPVTIGIATLAVVLLNQEAIKNSAISQKLGDIFYDLGQGLVGDLVRGFTDGINAGFTALGQFLVEFIPNAIINPIKQALGIGSPSTVFFGIGVDIMEGLALGLAQGAVAIFNFFTSLPGRIIGWVGNVTQTLTQKGTDLIQGLLSGLATKVTEVFNFFSGLAGRIVTATGRLAWTLFNAGVDLVQGLLDGIGAKAKDIVGFLKNKVTDVIPGFIKGALGIGSPSKVLAGIGEDIGAGLIEGMDKSISGIESAAAQMATAAVPVVPAVSSLPAVTAALPVSAGSAAAGTAGSGTATASTVAAGGGGIVINVQTTSPNPVDVGLETVRQLRAEQFRNGR